MTDFNQLSKQIKSWGKSLGFQQIGITDIDLDDAEVHFLNWIKKNRHGSMEYMARHDLKRTRPDDLLPGTLRIISVRMDYFPPPGTLAEDILKQSKLAYISRYALGRDYHKVLRKKLQQLCTKISLQINHFNYRVFTDSAPVLEKALAEKAGIGWIGKHSNLINKNTGSWYFLGEIYTNIPLPTDSAAENHCGSCQSCIDVCPTRAIIAPYEIDARLCISYLTIELRDAIPVNLRPLIGNRIYGCDDCQLVCPWNKFTHYTQEQDFMPRHHLDAATLIELFDWSENEFLQKTEGSPIRRIGYDCWIRNIAVAMGNNQNNPLALKALLKRRDFPSPMAREHIEWAIARLSPSVE